MAEAEGEANEWYFAFGANMSSPVLEKRRGMTLLRAERARVQGWARAFVERGVPLLEPVFSGLVEAPDDECWGVVYELSVKDSRRLDGLEASGYSRVYVDAESESFGTVRAFAYASSNPVYGRKPSRRYLRLLLDGAREHGLPADVIDSLLAEPSVHIPVLSSLVPMMAGIFEAIARRR